MKMIELVQKECAAHAHGGGFAASQFTALLEAISVEFDLLLGRRTYEMFAAFWHYAGDHPVARAFNKAEKYVVTNSLGRFDWMNSHRLSGDAVEQVIRLKASDGPELHIVGSSQLLQTLIAAQLVDE